MLSLRTLGKYLVTDVNKNRILSFKQETIPSTFLKLEVLATFQVRDGHNSIHDLRKDYNFKKERPIGPHKHKPPNLVGSRAAENYRHIIHYPEDGKYTIKKLDVTKLGGRHPVTGRKVIEGVGGGSKQKSRWIDWLRVPAEFPRDGTVLEERVIQISYDPMRDARITMTGWGDRLRWQVATDKIKEGDIIRTYTTIPVNPIRPIEGDSHPLGALPVGTTVCQIEKWPGEGAWFAVKAEENAKILRRVGDRVVIKCWDMLEFSIPDTAQCVVGTNSIDPLKALPTGSPNRMRWLGMRPRSGLYLKKTGHKGRKVKKPPPTIETTPHKVYMKGAGKDNRPGFMCRTIVFDNMSEGTRGRVKAKQRNIIKDGKVNW